MVHPPATNPPTNCPTTLFEAVASGHTGNVRELLKGQRLHRPSSSYAAVGEGCVDKRCPRSGATAVYVAAEHGHAELIRILVEEYGGDARAPANNGVTPLHIAAEGGHVEVIKTLVQLGADVSLPINGGWTPLHIAAENGHADAVTALVTFGNADLFSTMDNGATPFFLAAENGHTDVITTMRDLLLLKCAPHDAQAAGRLLRTNVFTPNANNGWSPMQIAVANGHAHAVSILGALASENMVDEDECSALLMMAAEYGHDNVVRALIRALHVHVDGVSEGSQSVRPQWTPLLSAVEYGHVGVVAALVELGADVHAATVTGATPLHIAAENGHADVVQLLIQLGAETNAVTQSGATPMHAAVENGNADVVAYLVSVNPDLVSTAMSDKGFTPLMIAAERGHVDAVRVLAQNGADVHAALKSGICAVYLAAENGCVDIVRMLVEDFHADVNARTTDDGWTTVLIAARNGHADLLTCLVDDLGADVFATTTDGWSPCHAAASGGHVDVIRALVSVGADESNEDTFGVVPAVVAMECGHEEIANILIGLRA